MVFTRLLILFLLWHGTDTAGANALEPPALEIMLDEPLQVTIAGQPASLAFVVGTVDHLILNDPLVQRLGPLLGSSRKADMFLDSKSKVDGKRSGAMLEIAGLRREQQLYWFPGQSVRPLDGSIGIMAVPHQLVRLQTGSPGAPLALRMPLAGDVDSTAYGLVNVADAQLAVTLNPSIRTSVPLIASTTGFDLASVMQGRFEGEPWDVVVMPGVRHTVRRLVLDTPLQLGRLSFGALAARFDAAQARRSGPKPRGKPLVVLTLSRTQFDEQGCSSLVVDKQQMSMALHCTGPGSLSHAKVAGAASAPAEASPSNSSQTLVATHQLEGLAAVPLPGVPGPAMAPDGFINLQVDQSVHVTIAGIPVELALNTGDLPGILLNEVAAMRLELGGRAQQSAITYGGRKITETNVARETVVAMERAAATNIIWLGGYNQEQFSGSIELSSLPHDRLRLRLSPEEPDARPVRLKLSLPRPKSARGTTELPGIARFEVNAGLQKRWQLPLVSKSLAADLARVLGGRLEGRPWLETLGYRLRRPVRRLVLAKPLVIGPLSFKVVAVQTGGTPDASNRLGRGQDVLPDADSDPDELVVTGKIAGGSTGRWLNLSRIQLAEQRCTSLAIDKPAMIWELMCRGPA
ncbi:hypothetical protein GCM10007973_09530 [Polymorphobacter multimanifer]|uniref:Uncharacterized protein n=1 Tax=Polymorphobacter multimanifer TaxID=1070431 RepID=A0A841L662_9SPHN|nr:hypothetical protein [Polymorphobacter multimanifer]MBB6228429.1 hypothetical protein [Polymorphobacter multimanifer]GGI74732.1 hypothetical protein GCM10007973_09530 [Polymorphobacter multimanifer]